MATMTKPTSDITRAAERYLEQYGDPLVMNTYLKVTVLVLCAVCLALAAFTYKKSASARQYAPHDRSHQRRGTRRSHRLSQLPIPPAGS